MLSIFWQIHQIRYLVFVMLAKIFFHFFFFLNQRLPQVYLIPNTFHSALDQKKNNLKDFAISRCHLSVLMSQRICIRSKCQTSLKLDFQLF